MRFRCSLRMLSMPTKFVDVPTELIGASGRCYRAKELLQHRPETGSVWVATHGDDRYVMKDVPERMLSRLNSRIWPQLRQSPSQFLHLPVDTIPDRRVLVFQYLTDNFFQLVKDSLPMHHRRLILKETLKGVVDLHNNDIVHFDIKPDNIMVNCKRTQEATTIQEVMIIDLENAERLPYGTCIKGRVKGNENWRSPESHFQAELYKPADVFSFGLVCLYAMLGRVICGVDSDIKEHKSNGAVPALIRLQRLVSYFGDQAGVDGLIKILGDDEVSCQMLLLLWEGRNGDDIPYKPFADWPEVKDKDVFRDLIKGMMDLNPLTRFTADDALEHPWFADLRSQ